MKTIILYGPGESAKRTEAFRIKKQFDPGSISQIDLKQGDLTQLDMMLSSVSLFGSQQRLVVVENALETIDLGDLKKQGDDVTLVILAAKLKAASILLKSAKLLGARLLAFEGEKEFSVFPFLDCLMEQKKQSFIELEKLLEEYGGMYILTMIYYAIRRNILPLPASSFARQKILNQKKKFHMMDFERFYEMTLKTEFNIKNGTTTEKIGLLQLTWQIISRSDGL